MTEKEIIEKVKTYYKNMFQKDLDAANAVGLSEEECDFYREQLQEIEKITTIGSLEKFLEDIEEDNIGTIIQIIGR